MQTITEKLSQCRAPNSLGYVYEHPKFFKLLGLVLKLQAGYLSDQSIPNLEYKPKLSLLVLTDWHPNLGLPKRYFIN